MSLDLATPPAPQDPVNDDLVILDDGRTDPADPGSPADPARRLRRRLIPPLAASLVIQIIIAAGDKLPSVDGTAYFEAGRNLLNGNGYTREGGPELHFPPLAPVALALLEKLTGTEVGALRAWGLLTSIAVVAMIVLLAQRIWRHDSTTVAAAWLGGTMAGLTPLFTRQGGGSESIALAALLAAALFVLYALDDHRTIAGRTAWLAGSGFAVGMAYLARPESLLPGAMIGFALVLEALRRPGSFRTRIGRVFAWALPFGLVIIVCVFPYLVYLHGHTGKWSATDKSQDASIEAWRAVAENKRTDRDRVLYAVGPSGTSLGRATQPLTTLAKQDPRGWLGIVGVNVRMLWKLFVVPDRTIGFNWRLIPGFLLIFAGIEAWRSRRRGSVQLLVAMGLMPVVTCVAFFALPRYLVLTTAVLTLLAARGLVVSLSRMGPNAARAVLALTIVFMATSTIAEMQPLLPGATTIDPIEQRDAGVWIDANLPPNARIMTRSFHVQFYGHRPVVAMPSSDYATMMAFARRMGVQYIVASQVIEGRRRPEIYSVLMRYEQPPGLEFVKYFRVRNRRVRIYKLVPPPPPSDQDPIPLGYVSDG